MYTEIHNRKALEQDALYFKLTNAVNLNTESKLNKKLAGVYAIYKDNMCLYVGQTSNFASRIATHIRGKYENATKIIFFNIEDIGFSDFDSRHLNSKKEILLNSEKYLMTKLKPIENIAIDMDFKLNDDEKPDIFEEDVNYEYDEETDTETETVIGLSAFPSIIIGIHSYYLSVYDRLPYVIENMFPIIPNSDYEKKQKDDFYNTALKVFTGELNLEITSINIDLEGVK